MNADGWTDAWLRWVRVGSRGKPIFYFQWDLGLFSQIDLCSHSEELLQGAVVGTGEVGLTTGKGVEGSLVLDEGGREGRV